MLILYIRLIVKHLLVEVKVLLQMKLYFNEEGIYLMGLIPALISIVCSSFMLYNIYSTLALRGRVFQQILAGLAITDLIKCSSLLFGRKFNVTNDLCYFQEYVFQFGAMSQALTTVLICAVTLSTTITSRAPELKPILKYGVLCFFVAGIFLFFSIFYRTARLFCSFDSEQYKLNSDNYPLIAFSFAFILPLYVSVLADIVISVDIHRRLSAVFVPDLKPINLMLNSFVQRLRIYPLVIVACNILSTVFVGILMYTGNYYEFLGVSAAFLMNSTGIFISLNYFYHQKTLSPVCEKIKSFLSVRAESTTLLSAESSSLTYQSDLTTTFATDFESQGVALGRKRGTESSTSSFSEDVRPREGYSELLLTVE